MTVALEPLNVIKKSLDISGLGLVNKGDKVYLTLKPDESIATLIDEKYVDFNGKRLTLNEWGCKVTGWKSIRIYAYMAIVPYSKPIHNIT